MPSDERVLVITETHFRNAGHFEGFRPGDDAFATRLLDPAHYSFRPRSEVETEPAFKQLIPYVVLTCGGAIFHYRRGAGGGEARLRALRSIGIGGHISEADAAGAGDPYQRGLERELAEEVRHAAITRRELLGFIYDPRTAVGSVHLGVVHRFELTEPMAETIDPTLIEAGFAPRGQLRAAAAEFESWSQFALDAMPK